MRKEEGDSRKERATKHQKNEKIESMTLIDTHLASGGKEKFGNYSTSTNGVKVNNLLIPSIDFPFLSKVSRSSPYGKVTIGHFVPRKVNPKINSLPEEAIADGNSARVERTN